MDNDDVRAAVFGDAGRRQPIVEPTKFVSKLSVVNLKALEEDFDKDDDDSDVGVEENCYQREAWPELWEPRDRPQYTGPPGPGTYNPLRRSHAPAFSIVSRHVAKVHPHHAWGTPRRRTRAP